MNDPDYLSATVADELELFRRIQPDVIVTENQFSAALSSVVASIPLVTTAASVNLRSFASPLYDSHASLPNIEADFNKVGDRYKLAPVSSIMDLYHGSSALNVAPTLRELEPDLEQLPNLLYVGPLLDSSIELGYVPNELDTLDMEQAFYVYMSVGTLEPAEYVPVLCQASDETGCWFFVAVRRKQYNSQPLPQALGRVMLYESLPGLSTIMKCQGVITRGGQNTLMGCVLAQKYVLGFAGSSAEADFNLRSLEHLPEIARCSTLEFSTTRLRSFITATNSKQPSRSYSELAQRLRSAGGANTVLNAIERL